MPKTRMAIFAGLALAAVQGTTAFACGDKLAMMGGGVSFERLNRSAHRGNLVLWIAPESRLHAAERELDLKGILERAGHRVHVVENAADLQLALQAGRTDIILMDGSAAVASPPPVGLTSLAGSSPAMVAVLYEPTAAELSVAERSRTCVARADKQRGRQVVDTVAKVMANRDKGASSPCALPVVTGST
jgi:hypothetical protein